MDLVRASKLVIYSYYKRRKGIKEVYTLSSDTNKVRILTDKGKKAIIKVEKLCKEVNTI